MKQILFECLNGILAEPRERYHELMATPDHVEMVLKEGAQRARERSAPFLEAIRNAIGIRPLPR